MNDTEKEAIRVVADVIHRDSDLLVAYDWHEVLEVLLKNGKWVRITLEEIEDPTPKAVK